MLTATAAARRAVTVIRRIDHGAAGAGCGVAGPWRMGMAVMVMGVVVGMVVRHGETLYI